MINKKEYKVIGPFKGWVLENFPFIEADFDAITSYQLWCKVVEYLNKVIYNEALLEEQSDELVDAFNNLKTYVDNYFNNLDVQEEINNKLDSLVLDGTMSNLLNPIVTTYVNPLIENQNSRIETIESQVASVSGSPLVASSTSEMTDTTRIYVNTTDGKWYYYDGDSWEIGGTYQATENSDTVNKLAKISESTDYAYFNKLYDVYSLPYNKVVENSSNAVVLGTSTNLDCVIEGKDAKCYLTENKYYICYVRASKNSATTGINTASQLQLQLLKAGNVVSGMLDSQVVSHFGNTAYVPNDVEKVVYIGFQATETASNYNFRAVVQGAGTNTHTVSLKYINIGYFEFDTEEEYNKAIALMNYVNQDGIILVNDVMGRAKEEDLQNQINALEPINYDTDIIYWGDSLTQGAGGEGTNYPQVCSEILNKTYINAGVGGETANTISARQGGNNIYIPAGSINGVYDKDDFIDIFGYKVTPLLQGHGQNTGNKLYINKILCDLSYNSTNEEYTISGYTGESSNIPVLATFKGYDLKSKVTIIFVGQNGSHVFDNGTDNTNIQARIGIIDSMISKLPNKNYVVLGLSTGTTNSRHSEEFELLKHYGNKFFNTREMLVNYGLTLQEITPTTQDTADISNGTVPTSLRYDEVHLNSDGYQALGKMLADKINSLKYF